MRGYKTTEEESNFDECNNSLNPDNNSEFRIHITERSKNKSTSEHKPENDKKTDEDNKEETNKRETGERNDPSNIILWVIEIITIGVVFLLVANNIITPLTDFLVELFGGGEYAILRCFFILLCGGIVYPLHNFFKSIRK